MNILHLSRSDSKAAGISAYNLHFSLLNNGYESRLLVEYDSIYDEDDNIISYSNKLIWNCKRFIKRVGQKIFKSTSTPPKDPKYNVHGLDEMQISTSTSKIFRKIKIKPDVIFIYFPQGFINSRLIKEIYEYYNVSIYWYLMDMGPMTGGCHYAWNCEGYKTNCGSCPAIYSYNLYDITFKNLEFKKNNLKNVDLRLIIGADWLIEKAKQSELFKNLPIKKIMLPVNEKIFRPSDKNKERDKLGLPKNKKIFFFGAQSLRDPRKGIKKILDALDLLKSKIEYQEILNNLFFIYAGNYPEYVGDNIRLESKYIGILSNDESLASAYQASDFFICSSLQDTGPYMLIEAVSCGIPVVSFNMGLAYEFIETNETGYKARLGDIEDLAKGIIYVAGLNNKEYERLSKNCLSLANANLSMAKQIEQVEELLNEIE